MPERPQTSALRCLIRGLAKRCPACGRGRLFDGWYELRPRCEHCGLTLERQDGDSWGLTYMTTAALTGVFILAMLLYQPESIWLGRAVVVALAAGTMFGSLPNRKGVAIAVDYLIRDV